MANTCWLHVGEDDFTGKIIPFSKATHEKCFNVMIKRQKIFKSSKYSNIIIPPEIPEGGYHLICYRRYTALSIYGAATTKQAEFESIDIVTDDSFLNEVQQAIEDGPLSDASDSQASPTHSLQDAPVKEFCVICERNKYKNKKKLRLKRCTSRASKELLLKFAEKENKLDLIAKMQDQTVTVYYHSYCLSLLYISHLGEDKMGATPGNSKRSIHITAFQTLCKSIDETIIQNENVVSLEELYTDYTNLLLEYGDVVKDDYTYKTSYLKLKIMSHFGERLSLIYLGTNKRENCYFFKSTLSVDEITEQVMRTSSESNFMNSVKKVAYGIRKEILSCLPPDKRTEDIPETMIPKSLKIFYECLLNGPDKSNLTETKKRKCLSLCHDTIISTNNGRKLKKRK